MAYGPLHFAYSNYITSNVMISPDSQEDGFFSGVRTSGSGVALAEFTGPFQGAFDLTITVEIDSIAGGTEIGEATFKWRTSDTATGSWEETGVPTTTSPYALSADGLGTNMSIAFTGGVGNDFALADSSAIICKATYGPEKLLDRNRMTVWRSDTSTSERIVIDLGAAKTPTLFILHDHNLTSGASVTLDANASDSWGSPSLSYSFTTITDPLYYYIPSGTYRYWSLNISDAGNPDGYIEAANMFLGTYEALKKVNGEWGSTIENGRVIRSNRSNVNVLRRYDYGQQKSLSLNFGNTVSNDDIDTLIDIQESLIDSDTRRILPCWIHGFSDQADTLRLMDWENLPTFSHAYFSYLLNSGVSLQWSEVVKI